MPVQFTKAPFWLAILGALKLLSNAFGLQFEDKLVNDLSNGFAAFFTVIGVFMDFKTKPPDPEE